MKVIKCSDETYAFVCRVAAERKTYLADAVDFLVFKQSERIAELEAELEKLGQKQPVVKVREVPEAKEIVKGRLSA